MYSNILIPVLFDEGHDETQSFETAKALAAKVVRHAKCSVHVIR